MSQDPYLEDGDIVSFVQKRVCGGRTEIDGLYCIGFSRVLGSRPMAR